MSEGEKRCEACGGREATERRSTGLAPGIHDLCLPCSIKGNDWLKEAITSRRRSAEPAVASEFRDVDHVEVRVGDWLTNIHDGTMVQVGWLRAERPNAAQPGRALKADGSPSLCRMAEGLSYHWRKSAAPPGGEKAKGREWDGTPGDWPNARQWMHICRGQQSWILDATEDCGRCGLTFADANKRAIYPMKTPGGSADAATEDTEKATGAAACASAQPPGSSLAAFTAEFQASVKEELLPKLPKGWKAISDAFHDVDDESLWSALFILDGSGKQVLHDSFDHPLEECDADRLVCEIARQSFDHSARHQPEPPRTETSWLDGYLMSRAAEKPRGGGDGSARERAASYLLRDWPPASRRD